MLEVRKYADNNSELDQSTFTDALVAVDEFMKNSLGGDYIKAGRLSAADHVSAALEARRSLAPKRSIIRGGSFLSRIGLAPVKRRSSRPISKGGGLPDDDHRSYPPTDPSDPYYPPDGIHVQLPEPASDSSARSPPEAAKVGEPSRFSGVSV